LLPCCLDPPAGAIWLPQAVAEQAVSEGVAPKRSSAELAERITQVRWHPVYPAPSA
jgi:malate dehydrogenase (oxaloacetate-decarboxylating)